ncbi:uncharacterized protein LTR77_005412 [Saxophila tyrrhenica]|uniref:Uncharacterized protein n=1 Tax=Saxophila tyrrhenica TaxID=1690608 RepID=A0AAV9P8Q2_9PEZI|nr:hypothetical protein LTR77_005412 [Saxophila tyrrhenica]
MGIHDLESSLGLMQSVGSSNVDARSYSLTALADLHTSIKRMKKAFRPQLSGSFSDPSKLRAEADALFDRLGPQLWPDPEQVDTSSWLSNPKIDNLSGHWRHHREFKVPAVREELCEHLVQLIYEKCYYERQQSSQENAVSAASYVPEKGVETDSSPSPERGAPSELASPRCTPPTALIGGIIRKFSITSLSEFGDGDNLSAEQTSPKALEPVPGSATGVLPSSSGYRDRTGRSEQNHSPESTMPPPPQPSAHRPSKRPKRPLSPSSHDQASAHEPPKKQTE